MLVGLFPSQQRKRRIFDGGRILVFIHHAGDFPIRRMELVLVVVLTVVFFFFFFFFRFFAFYPELFVPVDAFFRLLETSNFFIFFFKRAIITVICQPIKT